MISLQSEKRKLGRRKSRNSAARKFTQSGEESHQIFTGLQRWGYGDEVFVGFVDVKKP
jgi:hypothetical protein